MKNLFLIFSAIISINSLFSQTINKTIDSKRIGSIKCEYKMSITGNDTSYSLFCFFQNRKYTQITDLGSVGVWNMDESKSGVRKMIDNLEKSLVYLEQGDVDVRLGDFQVYDSSNELFVMDGRKYTVITKGQIRKWISWLKTEILEEVEVE